MNEIKSHKDLKRILWVNPSFLDYRIPLYEELNKICDGNFYLIYSRQRVPDRCFNAINNAIGNNAITVSEKRFHLKKRNGFANSGMTIPFPKGLSRAIKRVKPDLILAEGFFQFTPWAVWYSWVHRIPLVIAYERTAHTERNCPAWRRLYRKFIGLFTNGYVANGQLTKEYLMSQGVKAENIFTGGMCADSIGLARQVAAFSKSGVNGFRQQLLGGDASISYVVVGQMIPRKGVNYLLAAWSKHRSSYPNDKLVLVGSGPELNGYIQQYKEDSSIIFAGGVDYSQIYKYYAACDVFVIATLEDNWSLVVPEAMACGLPIACSIYNGCHPELVHKDENGITFDPLDQSSIVAALDYFHHVDLKQFGRRSVEIERDFNPENTARNVMQAVNRYLKD